MTIFPAILFQVSKFIIYCQLYEIKRVEIPVAAKLITIPVIEITTALFSWQWQILILRAQILSVV